MKALVLFHSHYGNTEQIAKAVASGISQGNEVKVVSASDVTDDDLTGIDLLVVGSPTIAWRVSNPLKEWLNKTPDARLHGIPAAPFDTGFKGRLSGSAAKGIDRRLRRKGCLMVSPPTRFFVTGLNGPLLDGELVRATEWGREILSNREKALWYKAA